MKFRNLLMASAVALLGFTSCSNNDVIESNEPVAIDGDLRIKLDVAAVSRVESNKVTDKTPKIQDGYIYLLDANNKIVKVIDIIKNNTGLEKGETYIIENVNNSVQNVAIVANKEGLQGKSILKPFNQGDTYAEENVLDAKLFDIQEKDNNILYAPLAGKSDGLTEGDESESTGNTIYTANVTIAPLMSRVQVFGKLAYNKERISELRITKIFLDNVRNEAPGINKLNVEKTKHTELDDVLKDYKTIFDLIDYDAAGDLQEYLLNEETVDNSKAYAYHVFPQTEDKDAANIKDKSVKLILELRYTLKGENEEDTGEEVTAYATLRFATHNNNKLDEAAVDIKAAKIYNIDLGKIDWNGDGNFVDPNPSEPGGEEGEDKDEFNPEDGGETPNADQKDLNVIVEIKAFEEVNIIPQN